MSLLLALIGEEDVIPDVEPEVTRRALSARYRLAVAAEERRHRKLKIEEVAEELAAVVPEPVIVPPAPKPRVTTKPQLATMYLAAPPRDIVPERAVVGDDGFKAAIEIAVAKENARHLRLMDEDDLFLMAA